MSAPHVATQNGTQYVRTIRQTSAGGTSPRAMWSLWLMAVSTVPTTSAVNNERRSSGRNVSTCRKHRKLGPPGVTTRNRVLLRDLHADTEQANSLSPPNDDASARLAAAKAVPPSPRLSWKDSVAPLGACQAPLARR